MEDSQREGRESRIYEVIENHVPKTVLSKKNKAKSWTYGYDDKYDMVVISRDGTIGDIYLIEGLRVAIPLVPEKVFSRSKKQSDPDRDWETLNV